MSYKIFRALGDETRIRILKRLAFGDADYTTIMRYIGLDPIVDSGKFVYHLKLLEETGLIEKGSNKLYSLRDLGCRALGYFIDLESKESKFLESGLINAEIRRIDVQIEKIKESLKKMKKATQLKL